MAERSERKVFWGAFFSKKVRPCPYRRAAHKRKLGKQRSVFPGRWRTEKAASRSPLRPLRGHSRLPARSSAERCPLGTSAPQRGRRDLAFCKLSAAHILGSPFGGRYVPVGRCPAADRGGSRDAVAVRRLRGQAASLTGRSRGYRPYGRVRPGRWFLFRLPPIRARSRLFEKRRPKNF